MKIAVIGAGASGLLVSGLLAKKGHNVILFEKNNIVGKKLLITGNGRCNITNSCDIDDFLLSVPKNPKFLYTALTIQPPSKTIEFFNNLGIKTKIEENNKVFPKSDKSSEVVEALYNFCKNYNVKINLSEEVIRINNKYNNSINEIESITTNKNTYKFDKIIVATGGASYKNTGSTGDGYKFAKDLNIKTTNISGSLVGLISNDKDLNDCTGLSLKNISLNLVENKISNTTNNTDNISKKKKCVFSGVGEMIFTHFGISGPLVFKASSYMKDDKQYNIYLDFYSDKNKNELNHDLIKYFDSNKNKDIVNVLNISFPKKLIPILLKRCNLLENTKVNSLTKEQRESILNNMKEFEIPISKKRPIDEATITRGGISVKEINPKTMECKNISGLYFIGEILDVDALTGGFNLQIAWSTAYLMALNFIDN